MGIFSNIKKPKRIERTGLLFCLESDPIKIIDQIENMFGGGGDSKTNNYTLQNGDMKIFMAASGLSDENANGTYAKNQINGVQGFVYAIKTTHVDIKRNLFYHLRQCKAVVRIDYGYDNTDTRESEKKEQEIRSLILNITDMLQGVVTLGDGTAFLDSKGQLILDDKGKTSLDFYMPTEILPGADWGKDVPAECRERKERSMAWLKEKHIYVTPWLPFLIESEQDGPARTAREICGRAAALLIVSLYSECRLGEGMDYQQAKEFIAPIAERFEVDKFLSPKEKAYLDNPDSTQKEQISYSWQYENLMVMEWALGLAKELPYPDKICDVPETSRILRPFESLDALEEAAVPRPYSELLDAADLIYRLDWACVDARVMGMPAPAGLDSGVVMERHHALFWLAGVDSRCPWDDVDLST